MTPEERKRALRAEVQSKIDEIEAGEIHLLWEIIDRLVEECAESQHQAADAIRREMRQWYASPAFQTYVDLRYGVVGRVLKALQDEQISLNRALECLAEIAHGATEITLPDTKEE